MVNLGGAWQSEGTVQGSFMQEAAPITSSCCHLLTETLRKARKCPPLCCCWVLLWHLPGKRGTLLAYRKIFGYVVTHRMCISHTLQMPCFYENTETFQLMCSANFSKSENPFFNQMEVLLLSMWIILCTLLKMSSPLLPISLSSEGFFFLFHSFFLKHKNVTSTIYDKCKRTKQEKSIQQLC